MEQNAVVERLKEYGQTRTGSHWDGLDVETEQLLRKSAFAFLVAVAFDRGMPWQKAWQIPTEIHRKGLLDPVLLAFKSETELKELLDGLPVRPRYGGAKTLSDAAKLVCDRFNGDAEAIWRGKSPAEVEKTLERIHGVGAGIAAMTTRILRDEFGCFKGQEWQIDVKPDVHLLRVFRRTGLIEGASKRAALQAARDLSPEFPGELDWPAWSIGKQWCHQTAPDCARCPLAPDCPKRI